MTGNTISHYRIIEKLGAGITAADPKQPGRYCCERPYHCRTPLLSF